MRVLSLFSGVGGLCSLGLGAAGHEVIGMCEIDDTARSVLRRHHPDTPIWKDVADVHACLCNRHFQSDDAIRGGADIERRRVGSSAGADRCERCGEVVDDECSCRVRGVLRGRGADGHRADLPDQPVGDSSDGAVHAARCERCGGVCGRVDLVAGGSPCQDLSVAGKRAGLDGGRSGLFWQQCRIADEVAAGWVVWENVAGAFSSNDGADFAAVLWGITGALPRVPDEGWRTCGVVVGPKRSAVWRLLDAQWFGVAQRRRRVFVVGGPRALCGPEILALSESVSGHSRPSRASRSGVAALTSNGVGTCGADDNQAQAGHLIAYSQTGHGAKYTEGISTLTATDYKRPESHVITAGDEQPEVVAAFDSTWSGRYPISEDDLSPTVKVGSTLGVSSPPAIAFSAKDYGADATEELAPTLRAGEFDESHMNGGVMPAVVTPYTKVIRSGARDADGTLPAEVWRSEETAPTLNAHDLSGEVRAVQLAVTEGAQAFHDVATPIPAALGNGGMGYDRDDLIAMPPTPDLSVRRLTPRECERLMGWPDDHTRWSDTGTQIADAHRYRMCGNGVVAPVAAWIGRLLNEVET